MQRVNGVADDRGGEGGVVDLGGQGDDGLATDPTAPTDELWVRGRRRHARSVDRVDRPGVRISQGVEPVSQGAAGPAHHASPRCVDGSRILAVEPLVGADVDPESSVRQQDRERGGRREIGVRGRAARNDPGGVGGDVGEAD